MENTENTEALRNMENFKQQVKTWLQLDDKMAELQQQIKAYKQQQKELTPLIIHFMNERNIQEISSNEGSIRFNVAKSRAGLSNKKLQSTIASYFNNDEEKTKQLIDHIMENREIKEIDKQTPYHQA